MRIAISLLIVLICIKTSSQTNLEHNDASNETIYIWCPQKVNITPQAFPKLKVRLQMSDSRIIPGDMKGKCDFSVFKSQLEETFRNAWPDANFVTDENQNVDITIMLAVNEYQAKFFTGVWIGYSKITYKVKDNRTSEPKESTKQVSVERKAGNALGKENGKRALMKAYDESIRQLINEVTMSVL